MEEFVGQTFTIVSFCTCDILENPIIIYYCCVPNAGIATSNLSRSLLLQIWQEATGFPVTKGNEKISRKQFELLLRFIFLVLCLSCANQLLLIKCL